MAERERSAAPPKGGIFVPRTTVMDADDLRRAVTRIAHEIVERNHGLEGVALVGLQTGGVPLAQRLAEALSEIDGTDVPLATLDVAFYRDDIGLRPVIPEAVTDISFDLTDLTVVLVDDVLFTGRTVRAALNALNDYGRPRAVQLAVMVDRGHRQLPIRPDFVGKNLPTRFDEQVDVSADGVLIGDVVGGRKP
jgi:pyrimidine operon attenuation protein/uracil phosphoribosyltransferase